MSPLLPRDTGVERREADESVVRIIRSRRPSVAKRHDRARGKDTQLRPVSRSVGKPETESPGQTCSGMPIPQAIAIRRPVPQTMGATVTTRGSHRVWRTSRMGSGRDSSKICNIYADESTADSDPSRPRCYKDTNKGNGYAFTISMQGGRPLGAERPPDMQE